MDREVLSARQKGRPMIKMEGKKQSHEEHGQVLTGLYGGGYPPAPDPAAGLCNVS